MTEQTDTRARIARPSMQPTRRILERTLHFLAYHFVLSRRRTRVVRVAGLQLTVPPSVFDPRMFLTSKFFAEFLMELDLQGKRVVDVGTGSGILAIAAAKAGAAEVVGVDINPNAVAAARHNAKLNGVADRVAALRSNLLSGIPPKPLFDLIISNPPFFEGEPRDIADRAWCAGSNLHDISDLFEQAAERLGPDGRCFLILSSSCDFSAFGTLIRRAGMTATSVMRRSFLLETMHIFELRKQRPDDTVLSGEMSLSC